MESIEAILKRMAPADALEKELSEQKEKKKKEKRTSRKRRDEKSEPEEQKTCKKSKVSHVEQHGAATNNDAQPMASEYPFGENFDLLKYIDDGAHDFWAVDSQSVVPHVGTSCAEATEDLKTDNFRILMNLDDFGVYNQTDEKKNDKCSNTEITTANS